jgi:DNA-directed RNA polymerase beta subunit
MIAEGTTRTIRNFSKVGDTVPIPDLPCSARSSRSRATTGRCSLDYISTSSTSPATRPDECRELRLTYGMPFRVRGAPAAREIARDLPEEEIYLGEFPS